MVAATATDPAKSLHTQIEVDQAPATESVAHLDPDSLKRYADLFEGQLKMDPLHLSPHNTLRQLVLAFTLGNNRVKNDDGELWDNPSMRAQLDHLSKSYGVVPIFSFDNNNNEYGVRLVFGLRPHQGNEFTKLRKPEDLLAHLKENFIPRLKDILNIDGDFNAEDVAFVLLPNAHFAHLNKLLPSETERKSYLHIIDKSYPGQVVFREIITPAISLGASDVHVDPVGSKSTIVRYRIDGVLYTQEFALDNEASSRLIASMVNFLGGEADNDKRKPLDFEISLNSDIDETPGSDKKARFIFTDDPEKVRFAPSSDDKAKEPLYLLKKVKGYQLRVARMPVRAGFEGRQKVTIRLHAPKGAASRLDSLNLTPYYEKLIAAAMQETQGMVLLTGPTGSGKTTTLYAALRQVDIKENHIVTCEDPVETEIPGATQVQIDSQNMGFPVALRSIMRSDPDVILIGEIRDNETADIAVQATNTGHVVLSTTHTNRAVSSFRRLRDLGVDASNLSQSVNLIIGQRLVRTFKTELDSSSRERILHPEVFESHDASQELNELFGQNDLFKEPVMLIRPKAEFLDPEAQANYNPFKGRVPILEAFVVTPKLRTLISKGADEETLLQAALTQEIHPYEYFEVDGLRKVLENQTSLAELASAVGRNWSGLPEIIQQKMIAMIRQHVEESKEAS